MDFRFTVKNNYRVCSYVKEARSAPTAIKVGFAEVIFLGMAGNLSWCASLDKFP